VLASSPGRFWWAAFPDVLALGPYVAGAAWLRLAGRFDASGGFDRLPFHIGLPLYPAGHSLLLRHDKFLASKGEWMMRTIMRFLPITLFALALFAQDPKTFYQQLPTAQPSQALFQQMMIVSGQIATLAKTQVQDLIPLVFAAIKADPDGSKNSDMGLHAISRRSDSGEVLKPFIKDIAALLSSPNPAFKATAGIVFENMNPAPPEATDILLGFISGPTGAISEKIDALSALTHLPNPP
jgi:hypothetical protein